MIARKFGKEFFDGDRNTGTGINHMPRFYKAIPTFQDFYNLSEKSTVLDVGCAKGFMLHDLETPRITTQQYL